MKNKKVVLSVLSAAVVSSMASSAFAAELKNGIYLGGNVDKFYSLSSFFSDANEEQAIAELEQIGGFSKTVFVVDGKAAFLNDYLKNDDAALQDPTPEMFADGPSYKEIDKDGNIVKEFEPVDPTPPPAEELEVESVSAITETGKDALIYTNVDTDKTVKIVATAKDANNVAVPDATFSFTSSNPEVATVAEDGTVTAVGDGVARITVKTTNAVVEKSAYVDITVDTQLKATQVTALAKNLLKVDFSTALNSTAEFNTNYVIYKSDFTTISASKAEFVPGSGNKSVYVTLAADVELEKSYTLRMSNLKDADGNTIVAANQNFAFTTGASFDTTLPALAENPTATSSNTIVLKLNKPVKDTAVAKSASNYTITKVVDETNVGISKVEFVNSAEVKITTSGKLVNGEAYKLAIKANTFEDVAGNKNTAVSKDFTGLSDTTAPVFNNVAIVGEQTVELEFNEDADYTATSTYTPSVAVFDVTAGANTYLGTVTDTTIGQTKIKQSTQTGHTSDAKYAEVDLSTATPAVTLEAGKSYKFVAKGFKNNDGVVAGEQVKTIDIPAVTLTEAKLEAGQTQKAILTFNQDVAVADTYTAEVYEVTDGVLKHLETLTTTGLNQTSLDANQLRLTTSTTTFAAGKTYRVYLTNVDNADGLQYSTRQYADFTVSAGNTVIPVLTSAVQVANEPKKVALNFDVEIDGTNTAVDYELYKAGSQIPVETDTNVTIAKDAADVKKAVLTLTGNLEEGASYTLKVKDVKAKGETTGSDWAQVSFTGKDYVDPTLTAVTLKNANTVSLAFDERVNISSATFTVLAADGTWVAATPSVSADGKTVTLTTAQTIQTGFAASNENIKISGVVKDTTPQANELTATEFATALAAATPTDNAKPVQISATIDNADKDVIEVKFSEELAAAPDNGGFTLNGFGSLALDNPSALDTDASIVKLDLDADVDTVALNQGALSLTFTGADAADADSNVADAFANLKVTENIAPAVATATVLHQTQDEVNTGDKITLEFTEELLTSTLTADDIEISVDDDDSDSTAATVLTGSDLTLRWIDDATLEITIAKTSLNVDVSGANAVVSLDVAASEFEDNSNNENDTVSEDLLSGFQATP